VTASGKDREVPDFGQKGSIEFDNVNLRYRPTTDLVLKTLSFKI
jgi:ABC-type multidrug transport system fused ATPase/permease subunit